MEQIRLSHNRTTGTILAISKKHWATYIGPSLAVVLGLLFLIGKSYIIGLLFLIVGTLKILSNKSTSWTLTSEDLIIQTGFLPWKKTYFEIPKEDIFEAFYSHGLIANMFGYGTLTIRRTEGTTSIFSTSGMTNPKEITGSLNSLLREIKKSSKINFLNVNNNSIADELIKLSELKNQGLLNEEEFHLQKQRLIKND